MSINFLLMIIINNNKSVCIRVIIDSINIICHL